MSQAGYTPIQLYYSTTAAAAPSAGNLAAGELAVNITDGKLFYKDNGGVVRVLATAAGSAGDVVGPGSSTDNALVRFDGTTGKLVQSSVGILSDAGALSGLTSVAATTFTGALTGNASTATTLQTSRTIWGQSFDGSANVTGALTGVTDLTASGSLTLNGGIANGVAYLNGSKALTTGSALTFDGTNGGTSGIWSAGNLKATAGGYLRVNRADNNTFNEIKYISSGDLFYFNQDNGGAYQFNISGSEQMRLTSTGLGIGTSSPGGWGKTVSVSNTTTDSGFTFEGSTRKWGIGGGYTDGAMRFYDFTAAAERMRLDSSGNLGLGVTPSAWSSVAMEIGYGGNALWGLSVNDFRLSTNLARISGGNQYKANGAAAMYNQASGGHYWYTAPSGTAGNAISFTQAMTLDASGNLLVGTTSGGSGSKLRVYASGTIVIETERETTASATQIAFKNPNGIVGTIETNGSLTLYNTTSDYRLKTVVGTVTDSGARIDALEPVEYTWNADGSRIRGFLAHKFQEVYAGSVTGTKDAVDADGKPVYQAMQAGSAEVIADLVAELQSLRKRLADAGIA